MNMRYGSGTDSFLTAIACSLRRSISTKTARTCSTRLLYSRSPDFAGFGVNHGLASFAAEGGGELWHVRHDAVDAVFAGRVRVGDGVDALILRALVFARPLRHANEVALVGREAVFVLEMQAGGLFLPGLVAHQRAAEVGNVFAAGELRVDVNIVDNDVRRVLVAQAVDAVLKAFGVG